MPEIDWSPTGDGTSTGSFYDQRGVCCKLFLSNAPNGESRYVIQPQFGCRCFATSVLLLSPTQAAELAASLLNFAAGRPPHESAP